MPWQHHSFLIGDPICMTNIYIHTYSILSLYECTWPQNKLNQHTQISCKYILFTYYRLLFLICLFFHFNLVMLHIPGFFFRYLFGRYISGSFYASSTISDNASWNWLLWYLSEKTLVRFISSTYIFVSKLENLMCSYLVSS